MNNDLDTSVELSKLERVNYRKTHDLKSSNKLLKREASSSLHNLSVNFDSRDSTPLKSSVERSRIPSVRKSSLSAEKKAKELQSSLAPHPSNREDFSFLHRRSQRSNSRAELEQYRSGEFTRVRSHNNSFEERAQESRPQRDLRHTPPRGGE